MRSGAVHLLTPSALLPAAAAGPRSLTRRRKDAPIRRRSTLQPADHIVQITARRQHPLRPSVTLVAQSREIFFFPSLSPCSRVRVYSDACDRHAAASLIPQCQTTTTGERSMHLFPLSAYRMNERIRDDDNEKDRTCPTGGRGVDLRAGL